MELPGDITVTVTQDDIDKGIPEDGCNCPIARAVMRAGLANPVVNEDSIVIDGVETDAGLAPLWELPDEAVAFIAAFDDGNTGTLEPFTFTAERDDQ
jgi:hypothetical protein